MRAVKELERIEEDLAAIALERKDVDTTIESIDALQSMRVANRVRVLRQGQVPSDVSFPKLFYLAPAGIVLFTGLVAGFLVLRELLDQRVRGPADVALIPRLRVIGMVTEASEDPAKPAVVETAFRDSPSGVVTESFRLIRAPLVKRMQAAGHKSLLIIGGMPKSGATTITSNLAMSCAASDQKVLIIDGNLRRPAQHKIFGLKDGPGLGDILVGSSNFDSALQTTSIKNLSVLSAGSPASRGSTERLGTEAMSSVIAQAAAKFDIVLVDASPAIVSGDGLALSNRCDAVALVIRAMGEKRGLVARLQSQFNDSRAEFFGVIVNAVRSSAGGYFKRNIKATHEYGQSSS
jgi:capsular exopolysaccharide synthesis family protein